jgi:single-stranded-DNA-specific exonuclease
MAEIKNLKKVADRILEAIKNKENIILYGDADLDGVASVIILKETIQTLGGKISAVYFPDREKEGYGISEAGLKFLEGELPALLIAVDCGIGNFNEVIKAKRLGFEVIIIEHHEILDKLPEADIIVDPKQKGDKYSFKGLASAGISFKLSQLLLSSFRRKRRWRRGRSPLRLKNKLSENLRRSFLELVAVATIADMMPRESENKIFIEEGLASLENSWRPGIKAFFETEPFKSYSNLNQKVSKIISILNIRDVKARLPAAFRLLSASDLDEAKKIVKKLLEKDKIRREKMEEIREEVEERLKEKEEPIIFEAGPNFDLTLIGVVASIICQKYSKPTFLVKKMEKESLGTVRTPRGIDSVSLMKKCKKYPLTYGGHPQASGFRIKNENLEKFKKCLITQARRSRAKRGDEL